MPAEELARPCVIRNRSLPFGRPLHCVPALFSLLRSPSRGLYFHLSLNRPIVRAANRSSLQSLLTLLPYQPAALYRLTRIQRTNWQALRSAAAFTSFWKRVFVGCLNSKRNYRVFFVPSPYRNEHYICKIRGRLPPRTWHLLILCRAVRSPRVHPWDKLIARKQLSGQLTP